MYVPGSPDTPLDQESLSWDIEDYCTNFIEHAASSKIIIHEIDYTLVEIPYNLS
jgi:hypothetical protein